MMIIGARKMTRGKTKMLIEKEDAIKAICEACEAVPEAPKPTGDLISRADAIEAVIEYWDGYAKPLDSWDVMNQTRAVLETLPSAEAVQGEWIDTGNWMGIECSRCKCHSRYVTPFCSQCGARMIGGDTE